MPSLWYLLNAYGIAETHYYSYKISMHFALQLRLWLCSWIARVSKTWTHSDLYVKYTLQECNHAMFTIWFNESQWNCQKQWFCVQHKH